MTAGKRVLLVEDERALLMLVGDALKDLGCEVVAMASGRQAIKVLEAGGRFDVVISDISMPEGVSGLDIARWAIRATPQVRVILVSGLSRAQLPPLPQEVMFLPKPYRVSQLMALLD